MPASAETARAVPSAIYDRLEGSFEGVLALDFDIASLTTYRLGGNAALYAEPSDISDLAKLKAALAGESVPVLVIGRGSNVLISDMGFPGVAIRLGPGFRWVDQCEGGAAAGAAMPLPAMARWCAEKGLTGMEFGIGIPASVGGAVRMNAGGHGSEISEVLASVAITDLEGEDRELSANELDFGYRRSSIPASAIVTKAVFVLGAGDPATIKSNLNEISRWRKANQPGGAANAGSIFKNPENDSAGRLIDAAGLKGLRVGGAEVSSKHANFIVADEMATSADVNRLIGDVRNAVFERFGVTLVPEIKLVGEFDDWPALGGTE